MKRLSGDICDHDKWLYKDLSYKIIGILYDVHNQLGSGYQEKYYCRAIGLGLEEAKIPYQEQVHTSISYNGQNIGRYFADFVIDRKIVLEVKINPFIYPRDIKQLMGYLKQLKIRLGLIASFTKKKVLIKRFIL